MSVQNYIVNLDLYTCTKVVNHQNTILCFDALVHYPRGGGYSHKMGYAYARTARVWFLPNSVLERVGF